MSRQDLTEIETVKHYFDYRLTGNDNAIAKIVSVPDCQKPNAMHLNVNAMHLFFKFSFLHDRR